MFEPYIAPGPLTLDCVEYQFDIDGHKLYRVKPDLAEMQRRQLVGVFRKLIIPSMFLKARLPNARANGRQRTTRNR